MREYLYTLTHSEELVSAVLPVGGLASPCAQAVKDGMDYARMGRWAESEADYMKHRRCDALRVSE